MTGILKVDTIQKNDGSVPSLSDLGINTTGTVVGFQYATWTNNVGTNNYTSTSYVDITGTDITYTPKGIGNRIVIVWQLSGRVYVPVSQDLFCYFRTIINGSTSKTWRFQGDNLGKLGDLINLPLSDIYIDEYTTTQNTTAETHKIQTAAGGVGSYFNQPHYANELQHNNIYLMEIAG